MFLGLVLALRHILIVRYPRPFSFQVYDVVIIKDHENTASILDDYATREDLIQS